jgi:hypothetical protein
MESANQLSNIEIFRMIGIATILLSLAIAGLGLSYLVVKHVRGIGISLGLGSILTGIASLMFLSMEIPDQYLVRTGIFALMSLMFFVVCFGNKMGVKSRKKSVKNQ